MNIGIPHINKENSIDEIAGKLIDDIFYELEREIKKHVDEELITQIRYATYNFNIININTEIHENLYDTMSNNQLIYEPKRQDRTK